MVPGVVGSNPIIRPIDLRVECFGSEGIRAPLRMTEEKNVEMKKSKILFIETSETLVEPKVPVE